MSRALWLAFGALSLGFVAASCTSSDGSADFDATGGEGVGGDSSSTAGTSSTSGKNGTGGSKAEAGAGSSEGGSGSSDGGAPGGGGDATSGGVPGGGGDATSGGMPGGAGDATSGGAVGEGGGRPDGDAGGPGDVPAVPCKSIKQCADGQVCFKAGCKAEEGVCADAEAGTPVCGCDGITYYDGSLAAGEGVDVGARGICSGNTAVTCDGKCKEGFVCGIVGSRGATCQTKLGGVCWMLPKECPKDDEAVYNLCDSEKCLSLCEAVQEGVHAVPAGLLCGG